MSHPQAPDALACPTRQLKRNPRPGGSHLSTICRNEMLAGSLVDWREASSAYITARRRAYEWAERPGIAGGTRAAGTPGSAADEPGSDRRDSGIRCGDCRAGHLQLNDPYEFQIGRA